MNTSDWDGLFSFMNVLIKQQEKTLQEHELLKNQFEKLKDSLITSAKNGQDIKGEKK